MTKTALVCLLLGAIATTQAVDVGIFDDTRLYSPIYNLETGAAVTTLSEIWVERGATWHQTGVISAEFLAQVSVFYTSEVSTQLFSQEEAANLLAWVKAGGTLVVTGDCG